MATADECGTCRFWRGIDGIDSHYGRCRRFPPTSSLDIEVGDGRLPIRLGMKQSHPETFRASWCGEFQK